MSPPPLRIVLTNWEAVTVLSSTRPIVPVLVLAGGSGRSRTVFYGLGPTCLFRRPEPTPCCGGKPGVCMPLNGFQPDRQPRPGTTPRESATAPIVRAAPETTTVLQSY